MCCILLRSTSRPSPNRNSPPAILLREGWREGAKTLKRTLSNLSHWPNQKIGTFRRLLRDEPLVSPDDLFCTLKTLPYGHVEAVLMAIRKLGLDSLLASKRCRQRDLVMAMIASRLLHPCSKLAITREWLTTTLAEVLRQGACSCAGLLPCRFWPAIARSLAIAPAVCAGVILPTTDCGRPSAVPRDSRAM